MVKKTTNYTQNLFLFLFGMTKYSDSNIRIQIFGFKYSDSNIRIQIFAFKYLTRGERAKANSKSVLHLGYVQDFQKGPRCTIFECEYLNPNI